MNTKKVVLLSCALAFASAQTFAFEEVNPTANPANPVVKITNKTADPLYYVKTDGQCVKSVSLKAGAWAGAGAGVTAATATALMRATPIPSHSSVEFNAASTKALCFEFYRYDTAEKGFVGSKGAISVVKKDPGTSTRVNLESPMAEGNAVTINPSKDGAELEVR